MNAGAYGGEMKDVLTEVTVMDEEGEIVTLPADKLELGYRTSIIKTAGYIVLEAKLQLKEGNPEVIRETMKDLTIRRTTKQPLEYPSAGSTFKRPEGYFAGKLIMDSGLAGYQVGGAQVSEKHCGFVINAGGATARDVRTLMDHFWYIVFKIIIPLTCLWIRSHRPKSLSVARLSDTQDMKQREQECVCTLYR